jgi:hypothetical protein
MIALAAPYGVQSGLVSTRGYVYEVLAPGCFSAAIASGLTPAGRPIPLVRGHRRGSRKRREWIVCDTQTGLRLWEDQRGLLFEAPGELPAGFTGVSVSLAPVRWERIGPQVFRLLEAGLRHIALLCGEQPAYPITRSRTLKL